MPHKNEFYFEPPELQRFRHLTQRRQHLNRQAGGLLPRCLFVRNATQSRKLAYSIAALARQIVSIQKRRQQMLADAQEPQATLVVYDFGVRCDACKDLPLLHEGDDSVVLAASEVCPPQPEVELVLDLADRVEESLISTLNSRFGARTAGLTRAISVLKSALLKQNAPIPPFRQSSFDPGHEVVILHKRFECTRCGKPMKWPWIFEDPRYIRALRRKQAREAEAQQQAQSVQETCSTVEKEAE
jgi:hypothetical protein